MIQAHDICLFFGSQKVFDEISFTVNEDQRIGLVGRNGSGKSTLLKAVLDPSALDDGYITTISSKKIAYMPQEVVLLSERSIIDETISAFGNIHELQKEIARLEPLLSTSNDATIVEQYATLQEELKAFNLEFAKAEAKKMLMGLGFHASQFEQPVSSLSVGWKMRIVLAKLLLQKADFYLFDEPTNHLDLVAKEWFLEFLKRASFGFMLVCHERYFLDELCTDILELERGAGTFYKGNYSKYTVQKEHDLQLLESAYIQQQKEIKRKQETIARFRASASKAKMAQSMMKALEKIELITMPPSLRNVNFSFPPTQQSGKTVITVKNVGYAFGEKTIFQNVSFEIERGQKVALVAPNGAGKTTLFNIITRALPSQTGSVIFGYNVKHAIFAQDQNRALDLNKSILDNLNYLCPKTSEQAIRSFLGSFLFSNDDVYKKVNVLSGGEKNRVGMISVLLQQANLLLLDEPTNHLDIPSKEILLKALKSFEGTVLFVSHDREFINDLATNVIELTQSGAHAYYGNYNSYIHQKKDALALLASETKNNTPEQPESFNLSDKKQLFELNKKSKRLEDKIKRLEQQIHTAQLDFAELDYGTPEFTAAQQKFSTLQQEFKETEAEWELLQKDIYNAQ